MIPLVTDIATVRKYLKVAFINQNAMLPDFEGAQKKYLLPILGKGLYTVVETEAKTNPSEPSDLLKLVLRATIPLAYFSDLSMVATQVTDFGVGTVASEHFVNAPRWQFLELKRSLEDKGCAALEELLIFLNEDLPEGIDWTIPDSYDLLISTGKAFNQLFSISQPYRTFECLRPIAKGIETDEIIPLIGNTFFQYLKTKVTPSELERQAIYLMKKAIAYLTIKSAAELMPINITADGFTVSLTHNTDQPQQGQQQAGAIQMSVLVNSCDSSGKGYLSGLMDLLNANASATVFADYFTSPFYKAPAVTTDNKERREGYLEWPEGLPTGLIDIDWQHSNDRRNENKGTFIL